MFPRFLRVMCVSLVSALSIVAAAQDSKDLKVGLVNEAACTDAKSREAAWRVLSSAPGLKAERLSSNTIHSAALNDYDVIVFPGGTGNGQARMLGLDGATSVTRYVESGKGVVAICAGGYLVAEGWNPLTRAIELVNAKLWDDDHWARGEGFIAVKVVGADDAASSRTMWFENGPIFIPAAMQKMGPYTPLVRYVTDMAAKGAPIGMMAGRDAVIAGTLGRGRVVVFGPHPELSPDLNHWLVNAVKWAAAGDNGAAPSVDSVLEGKSD